MADKPKWRPEPWYVEHGSIVSDQGGDDDQWIVDGVFRNEDAERIVACVNACAGVPTDIVIADTGRPGAVFSRMNAKVALADELAEALGDAYTGLLGAWHTEECYLRVAHRDLVGCICGLHEHQTRARAVLDKWKGLKAGDDE